MLALVITEVIKMYISDDFFCYDGIDSRRYGLRFSWVGYEQDMSTSSEKSYSFIKNNSTNQFVVSKSKYESPHQFKICIVAERALHEEEVRQIHRDFFNSNTFKRLDLARYDGEKIYTNCILSNPERIEGAVNGEYGVVGFDVTVLCDAPWGWSDEKEICPDICYADIGNGMKEAIVTVYNNSDVQEYIYPEISFSVEPSTECSNTASFVSKNNCIACSKRSECSYTVSDGSFLAKAIITNESDQPCTGLCVFAADDVSLDVSMNPNVGKITVSSQETEYGIKQTNKKFLRLVPGNNVLSISNVKPGTLKIKYREAKVFT